MENTRRNTQRLALLALLTAIVAVLQMLGIAIRFGVFAVSMVGVPVIIGGALLGPLAGAWLGLVFGVTVLLSGDATLFFAWDPAATVLIVLLKGVLAGLAAGGSYQLLGRRSGFGAALAAALAYPLVNTGVFFLGCMLFFLDNCVQFAANLGVTGSGPMVVMSTFIGFNFFFELGLDLVLCPVIVRIINARRPFAFPVREVKGQDPM
ncbi:MAG: ECF transporter S component [Oscillospiraceae bacterium]|jgi:uncharacterized membrane protein|nr:ECF transporter S component [Oscillospiraceae bacterium]